MNTLKKAFTLVELLISITILTVLGVIAFMSFFNNVSDTRDTIRIEDMSSIEKVLETHNAQTGEYPNVTNPGKITFTGDTILTAWEQGTFGETTQRITDKLFKTPVDPLTKKEYIYSLTNDKQEYQIAGIFEGKNVIAYNPIKQANANKTEKARLKIMGKYNGKILKIKQTKKIYILAVPSIIHGKIGDIQLMEILENRDLLYSGHFNLPQIYSDTKYELKPEDLLLVNPDKVLVYSGSEEDLTIDENQITFVEKLRDAYKGTSIEDEDGIIEIVKSKENEPYIAQTLLQNNVISEIEVTAMNNGLYTPPYPEGAFVSTWDVGIDVGKTGTGKLLLPFNGSNKNCDFTVDWGDGTTSTITDCSQAEMTHDYGTTGVYDVVINGNSIEGFGMKSTNDNQDDGDKLIDIKQWGYIRLASNGYQFAHCENLVGFSANDIPDLFNVTSLENAFWVNKQFNGNIDNWDVSNVTNMHQVFANSYKFNQPLNNWDVSNVTNMRGTFMSAKLFNQPLDNWDVSNVTDMTYTFYLAKLFNQSLNNWDVSNVTNMTHLFRLTDNFNGDISSWDVSNVISMDSMFEGANKFDGDISTWNIENVTNVNAMFWLASSFNKDLTSWSSKGDNITSCRSFDSSASAWEDDKKPTFTNCSY